MVLVCIVKSCYNCKCKTKEKGDKMHRFPKDMDLCKEWLAKCKRLDLLEKNFDNHRVCSKHFISKMYANSEETILLPIAIPTKFESTDVNFEPATVNEDNDLDHSTKLIDSSQNCSILEELVCSSTPSKSNSSTTET
ncbi:52 kDa repressor of the inhibitor of the protein kinase-like, partial [Aphis craccivora]